MMTFEDACALVEHVTHPGPSFYRHLYGIDSGRPLHIASREQWSALPFTRKEDLLAKSLKERTFIPIGEIDHLRPTSGTSGRGPLFCPRTPLRGMEYRYEYHDFKKPLLAYTVPAMPHWHEAFISRDEPQSVVVYDPANAEASVRIARDAGVDSMSLFAFHIPVVGECMKRAGTNEWIRFIEIAGEACTRHLFEYMRTTFPNATIIPFYGSSEVEDSPIGMPCRPITGEEPLSVYHGKESHYLEIIDPETLAVIEPLIGAEGELVISAYPGEPCSFPLVRFRTGDTVRVVDEKCDRHGMWSFTLLGRTDMDFVKIPGGVLRADEIERVLRTLPELVSDRFIAEVYEESAATGPRPSIRLYVEPKKALDLSRFAEDVSTRLRVSPHLTWAGGVREGRFGALAVDEVSRPIEQRKNKRLVRR